MTRYNIIVPFHWDEVSGASLLPCNLSGTLHKLKEGVAQKRSVWNPIDEYLWLTNDAMRGNLLRDGKWDREYEDDDRRVSIHAVPDMMTAFARYSDLATYIDPIIIVPRYNAWPTHYFMGWGRAHDALTGEDTHRERATNRHEFHEAKWYDRMIRYGVPTPASIIDGPSRYPMSHDAIKRFFASGKTRSEILDSQKLIGSAGDESRYFIKSYKASPTKYLREVPGAQLFEVLSEHQRWRDPAEALMVREWVDFQTVKDVTGDDVEDVAEWRYIFYNGALLAAGPNRAYLDPIVLDKLAAMNDKWLDLAKKADDALESKWTCIDIALTRDGQPMVVECNMGMASGLPYNSGPNYYERLFHNILKEKDSKP